MIDEKAGGDHLVADLALLLGRVALGRVAAEVDLEVGHVLGLPQGGPISVRGVRGGHFAFLSRFCCPCLLAQRFRRSNGLCLLLLVETIGDIRRKTSVIPRHPAKPMSSRNACSKHRWGQRWGVPPISGRYARPPERLRPAPASEYVQNSSAGCGADSPREARACRPVICGAPRRGSPAEKRLLGRPLLARRDRFSLPRVPAGRWPLERAEAPGPLARRRVRFCTRGARWCAQADKGGATRPVSCPTLHT